MANHFAPKFPTSVLSWDVTLCCTNAIHLQYFCRFMQRQRVKCSGVLKLRVCRRNKQGPMQKALGDPSSMNTEINWDSGRRKKAQHATYWVKLTALLLCFANTELAVWPFHACSQSHPDAQALLAIRAQLLFQVLPLLLPASHHLHSFLPVCPTGQPAPTVDVLHWHLDPWAFLAKKWDQKLSQGHQKERIKVGATHPSSVLPMPPCSQFINQHG